MIGKISNLSITIGFILGFLILTSGVSGATTLTVNASSTVNSGSTFTTIQGAINNASDGDIINVTNGTYNESIIINKSLILQGSDFPIINGSSNFAIQIKADNVTIDGFRIENPYGAADIRDDDYSNLTIKNNIVTNVNGNVSGTGNQGIAIVSSSSSSSNITSITIINNTINAIRHIAPKRSAAGIWIGNSNEKYLISDVIIQNNSISNITANMSTYPTGHGAYGILINHKTQGAQVQGNTISTLKGLWAHAIGLEGDTPYANVSGNIISNLVDNKTPSDAMALRLEDNPSASTVILTKNTYDGKGMSISKSNIVVNSSWNFSGLDPHTYPEVLFGSSYYYYGLNAFSTIQSAINNASDGDIINVTNGTYNESIIINKSLILQGSDFPIINGSSNFAIQIKADNVTIDGFRIENPYGAADIRDDDYSNLTIKNNIVTNVNGNVSGTGNQGIAIVSSSSSSSNITSITIINNTINAIRHIAPKRSAAGIWIGNSNEKYLISDVIIQNNSISNITANMSTYPTGHGAYGILINHKTQGAQVQGNTISTLKGLWAHAIGLEGDTPYANVSGNIISNLVDNKTPSDAMALRLESNPSASTVILNKNTYDGKGMSVSKSNIAVNNSWSFSGLDPNTYPEVLFDGSYYYYGLNAFSTIQDAIGNASAGDIINVTSGNYTGNINIHVGITLQSTSNASDTIINGTAGTIVTIDSDNVTVKGFTITNGGLGGVGIYSQDHSNLLIENNIITYIGNSSNDTSGRGIEIVSSNNNTLTSNNASNNDYGIYLNVSSSNTLSNNTANSNSQYGIYLSSSSNNTLSNNTMSNNTYNFYVGGSSISNFVQIIDTSNTVNGKPIYYLVGTSNQTINSSTSAGYVGVVNSINVTVSDLTFTNNGEGMLFVNTSNSSVLNVNASNNFGGIILAYSSNNNTLTNNALASNGLDFNSVSSVGNTIIANLFNNTKASFTYSGDIKVNSSSVPASNPSGYENIGKYLNVTNTTSAWVYLNVSYINSNVAYLTESTLKMWDYNGTGWNNISGINGVNAAQNYVYANLTSFSVFAPMGNDITPPSVNLISPANITYNTMQIPINYTSSDANLQTTWYQYNGTNKTLTANRTLTALDNKESTLILWANDTAGNINSTSVTFTVDTIPPSVNLISPTNSTYNTTQIPLNYTSSDANLQTTWYQYNSTNTTLTANITLTALNNQESTLILWANDTAGNINSTSVTFTVDTTPPTVTITSPANNKYFNVGTVEFSFIITDNLAPNTTYTSSLGNGTALNDTTISTIFLDLSDGIYDWGVTATDPSGNKASASVTFTVDTTPPDVNLISPANTTYNSTSIPLNYTSSDTNLLSIWYSYNGGGATLTSNISFTALNNQQSTLTLYANDLAGNTASTAVTFTVDTIPPDVNIISPANTTYYTTSIPINYTSSDTNLQTTWYQYNSTNTTLTANITLTALNNQESTLILWANDTAGNINSTSTTFTVDEIPPTITLNSPINNTYTNNTSMEFNFTAIDNLASNMSYDLYLNGVLNRTGTTLNNTLTSFSVTSLTDGIYIWNVTATDNAGNTGSSATRTFTVDTTPPLVNIISPTNTTYNTTSIPLNYTSSDTNLQTTWYQYNGTNTTLTANITLTALNNQESTLILWANDTAGNINSTAVTFTVDTIPPNVNIISPVNTTYSTTSLPLNYTSSDTNLQTTWYQYNGTNTTLTANITLTALNNQESTLILWANDTAGNINSTAVTFTVDTTPPEVTIISPLSITYNTSSVILKLSRSDNFGINTSLYSVDGAANLTYSAPTTVTELANGTHNIVVFTNDSVGNVNITSVFFSVDIINESFNNIVANALKNQTNVSIPDVFINISTVRALVGRVNVTVYSATPPGVNTSLNVAMYVEIDVSNNMNDTSGNLSWVYLRENYTSQEVNGLDESTLRLYWWNPIADNWTKLVKDMNLTAYGGPYVYDAGVNTVANYVWANLSHFSTYGISGSVPPTITPPTPPSTGGVGGYIPKVTLLGNSIDLSLAGKLVNYLKKEGIIVHITNASNFSNYKKGQRIIILGGQNAYNGIGNIVTNITSNKIKAEILNGSDYMKKDSVFYPGDIIYLFAGKDRYATKKAWKENYKEVATDIEYNLR